VDEKLTVNLPRWRQLMVEEKIRYNELLPWLALGTGSAILAGSGHGSRVSVSDPAFDPVLSFNMRVYCFYQVAQSRQTNVCIILCHMYLPFGVDTTPRTRNLSLVPLFQPYNGHLLCRSILRFLPTHPYSSLYQTILSSILCFFMGIRNSHTITGPRQRSRTEGVRLPKNHPSSCWHTSSCCTRHKLLACLDGHIWRGSEVHVHSDAGDYSGWQGIRLWVIARLGCQRTMDACK